MVRLTIYKAECMFVMVECTLCGKSFLTKQASYGHQAMCPENSDREIPDGWAPDTHGRWGANEEREQNKN